MHSNSIPSPTTMPTAKRNDSLYANRTRPISAADHPSLPSDGLCPTQSQGSPAFLLKNLINSRNGNQIMCLHIGAAYDYYHPPPSSAPVIGAPGTITDSTESLLNKRENVANKLHFPCSIKIHPLIIITGSSSIIPP